jgi:hypothetical protein
MPGSAEALINSPRTPLFRSDAVVLVADVVDTGAVGLDISGFRRLVGRIYNDRAGTLTFFFSDDGTTWEAAADVTTSTVASTPLDYDQVCYTHFARVKWTNGAVGATTVTHITVDGVAE